MKSLNCVPWFLKFSRVKYRRPLVMQTKMLKWQRNEFFWYTVFIIRQYVTFVQLSPNGCVCIIVCDTVTSTMRRPRSDLCYCAPEKKYIRTEIWRLVSKLPFHFRQIHFMAHAALCSRSVGKIFFYFFNSLKCVTTHSMPSSKTNIITIIVVQCKIFNFRHISFNLFSSSKKNKCALCGIMQRGTLWLMYRSSILWCWRLGGYGALLGTFYIFYHSEISETKLLEIWYVSVVKCKGRACPWLILL